MGGEKRQPQAAADKGHHRLLHPADLPKELCMARVSKPLGSKPSLVDWSRHQRVRLPLQTGLCSNPNRSHRH